jgi:hypothetical protein
MIRLVWGTKRPLIAQYTEGDYSPLASRFYSAIVNICAGTAGLPGPPQHPGTRCTTPSWRRIGKETFGVDQSTGLNKDGVQRGSYHLYFRPCFYFAVCGCRTILGNHPRLQSSHCCHRALLCTEEIMVGVFCAVTFLPKTSLVLRPRAPRRSQALAGELGLQTVERRDPSGGFFRTPVLTGVPCYCQSFSVVN